MLTFRFRSNGEKEQWGDKEKSRHATRPECETESDSHAQNSEKKSRQSLVMPNQFPLLFSTLHYSWLWSSPHLCSLLVCHLLWHNHIIQVRITWNCDVENKMDCRAVLPKRFSRRIHGACSAWRKIQSKIAATAVSLSSSSSLLFNVTACAKQCSGVVPLDKAREDKFAPWCNKYWMSVKSLRRKAWCKGDMGRYANIDVVVSMAALE